MKLHVLFQDSHAVRLDLINANITRDAPKRLATIELTPEQKEVLTPLFVGMDCGKERYEEIQTLWLEE